MMNLFPEWNKSTDTESSARTTPLISVEPIWLSMPDEPLKQKKKLNPDLVSGKQMRGVGNDS